MSDPDELALVFGREWPRILATLIRWTGSVQLAEDSVQEAFARAAESRDRALLINPAAWITTVAKRVAVDTLRRDAAMRVRLPQLVEDAPTPSLRDAPADDDLLGLLFLACSPLVSAETRLALALRFVCGVPTEAIADALLIEHRAMNARLTRAKHKIEHEGIRFASPDDEERDERLDDVLSTVYVLYTTGHSAVGTTLGTTATAIELARALRRLRPENPEVAGLLSLILLTEARASTRVSESGSLVTLEDADRRRWDASLIREGLDLAVFALPGGGRFALQAGIAGLHAEAPTWMATDWTSYRRALRSAPGRLAVPRRGRRSNRRQKLWIDGTQAGSGRAGSA